MTKTLLLILSLLLCSEALVITDSACTSTECQVNLMTYIVNLRNFVFCLREENGDFITEVEHQMPPTTGASGLSIFAYTYTLLTGQSIGSAIKYQITPPRYYREDRDNKMFLRMRFTDAETNTRGGCHPLGFDGIHYHRYCDILLEYVNRPQNEVIRTFRYRMTLKIPRSMDIGYILIAGPIHEYGCDCEIIADATYETKIFQGDRCDRMVTDGTVLTYGDTICLYVKGTDPTSSKAQLDVSRVQVHYRSSSGGQATLDLTSLAKITCNIEPGCVPGQVYVIIPLMVVGRLQFDMTVVLRETSRRLLPDGRLLDENSRPKGMYSQFSDSVMVVGGPDSSGSSIVTSIVTIAIILLLMF